MQSALKEYLRRSGVGWMLDHEELILGWTSVVGEAIASQTRVTAFRDGVLQIAVYSNTLKVELEQFAKQELLRHLREVLQDVRIRDLRFQLRTRPSE